HSTSDREVPLLSRELEMRDEAEMNTPHTSVSPGGTEGVAPTGDTTPPGWGYRSSRQGATIRAEIREPSRGSPSFPEARHRGLGFPRDPQPRSRPACDRRGVVCRLREDRALLIRRSRERNAGVGADRDLARGSTALREEGVAGRLRRSLPRGLDDAVP